MLKSMYHTKTTIVLLNYLIFIKNIFQTSQNRLVNISSLIVFQVYGKLILRFTLDRDYIGGNVDWEKN